MNDELRNPFVSYLTTHYEYLPDGTVKHKGEGHRARKGTKRRDGYLILPFRVYGKLITVAYHHVVWVLCHGRWPRTGLDHMDNNKLNNRIENLRECSASKNNFNILIPWRANKETGLPGVFVVKSKRRLKSVYTTTIGQKILYYADPYEAFNHATLCGKTYA